MSYDSSAFCGNVIQLTEKETFPPELPEFVGCRTVQCPAWCQSCPKGDTAPPSCQGMANSRDVVAVQPGAPRVTRSSPGLLLTLCSIPSCLPVL